MGNSQICGYNWYRLDNSPEAQKLPEAIRNIIKEHGAKLRNGQGQMLQFHFSEGGPQFTNAIMRGYNIGAFSIIQPGDGPLYFTDQIKPEDFGTVSKTLSEYSDKNQDTEKKQKEAGNVLTGIGIALLVVAGGFVIIWSASQIRYIVKGNK